MSIDYRARPAADDRAETVAAVAAEIRAWMGRRGMRQNQLARAVGENDQWVSTRVRGIVPVDIIDLHRIAEALGVRMVDLLPYPERVPTPSYGTGPGPVRPRSPLAAGYPTGARPAGHAGGPRQPPPGPRRTAPVRP